jgi:hypothetical protein
MQDAMREPYTALLLCEMLCDFLFFWERSLVMQF